MSIIQETIYRVRCDKCQFFVNCRCYLESQIPEDWKMFMEFIK